jgi:alpha-D-ribose 1-methylphosphonate 5-triphosphate synthase subunit PhnG
MDGTISTGFRREVLSLLVQATPAELSAAVEAIPGLDGLTVLRAPEIGLVMARARVGGDGGPFNLGEVTVTRAAVALATGEVGHGHVLGRDPERARLVAILDACCQSSTYRDHVARLILDPVRARLSAERDRRAAETAATRVDFFTMVRGED